jgi:hypothetical protein
VAEQLNDYACPECGFDGPHIVVANEDGVAIVECGDTECGIEFEVADG